MHLARIASALGMTVSELVLDAETILTAREHLSFQASDPWADYWKTKQTLNNAMKTLDFKR